MWEMPTNEVYASLSKLNPDTLNAFTYLERGKLFLSQSTGLLAQTIVKAFDLNRYAHTVSPSPLYKEIQKVVLSSMSSRHQALISLEKSLLSGLAR